VTKVSVKNKQTRIGKEIEVGMKGRKRSRHGLVVHKSRGRTCSIFSNWWTRKIPQTSRPAEPASFRKQVEYPAYLKTKEIGLSLRFKKEGKKTGEPT
jgi:hypothetical protein